MFSISSARLFEWNAVFITILRRAGLTVGVAMLATSLASPAVATPGLFGAQDASYDGVYRQSLVIAGLRAHHITVPRVASNWLRAQQCADGGFEAFRADLSLPCAPGDPNTYSGEDTNATAAAAIALTALSMPARSSRALNFLRSTQNADGGFPYYRGGASDANSTAMVMLAFASAGIKPAVVTRNAHSPADFLASSMLGCDAAAGDRGAFAYMPSTPNTASDMATVQVAAALSPGIPWRSPVTMTLAAAVLPNLACSGASTLTPATMREAVSGYLGRRLLANANTIPNGWGPGADLTSTAWAVIALSGANRAGGPASLADRALRSAAADYVFDPAGKANAGRVGLLLLLTAARHEKATSFGGVHLVRTALEALDRG